MANRPAGQLLAALYGPTSSGKTALAVQVATRIEAGLGRRVVIISADSRQVYRYLDIGTSKTTAEQMRGIRHEMLDVAEPVRKFELAEYARQARGHIGAALAAGAVPFVVGGTGVYLKALLEGWSLEEAAAARDALRRDFPRSMAGDAYAVLRRLDRAAAARVHPNNYEAVINALVLVTAASTGPASTGPASTGPASTQRPPGPRKPGQPGPAPPATVLLGLDPGPRVVDQRVTRTYDEQVRRGLGREIQDLSARYGLDGELRRRGPDSPNQVLHTHGYREYFEVAAERGMDVAALTRADLAEVRGRVIEHIRQYTRRQRSWFSKLPQVRMISSAEQAYPLLARALRDAR